MTDCNSTNCSTSANDKRKKRRESHNLVERRRRDGINTAIEKLSDLLPEMLLEPSGAGQTTHHLAKAALRGGGVGAAEDPLSLGALQTQNSLSTLKPNKAVVLSKT